MAHSLSPADQISLYFPCIKIFRGFFFKKKEDLLPLFHKILEGLCLFCVVGGMFLATSEACRPTEGHFSDSE